MRARVPGAKDVRELAKGGPTRSPHGSGGVFEIRIGDDTVWAQAEKGRIPEIKELKQIVRDRINHSKDLGHSDR